MPTTATTLPVDRIITLLSAAILRLYYLFELATPAKRTTKPAPDEWSAHDILAHLRCCSDLWGGAITRIISEDTPVIHMIHPQTYINQTDYLTLECEPSLIAFIKQRFELVTLLRELPPDAWTRHAVIIRTGPPTFHTAHHFANRLATHEHSHIRQLKHLLHSHMH